MSLILYTHDAKKTRSFYSLFVYFFTSQDTYLKELD